jgi:hypothetical protein
MQKLKEFEFKKGGGRSSYDWDTILDGSIYKLKAGEDFETSAESFRSTANTAAKRLGGKVRTSVERDKDGNDVAVVVQFFPENGKAPAPTSK